jgi:hypothetical protein
LAHNTQSRWETRPIWDVAFTAMFGAGLFILLIVVTGGLLVSLATSAGAIAALALFHYLFWGKVWSRSLGDEPGRARGRLEMSPPDEFTLALNDRERQELLHVLEQSLAEPPIEGRQPDQRDEPVIQELIERIRMFGA